jgi:GNAT superfamily N-acetyltransferase
VRRIGRRKKGSEKYAFHKNLDELTKYTWKMPFFVYRFDIMHIQVRKATKEDIPVLMALVKELAEFEKAPQEVLTSEEELLKDGFGEKPAFEAIVAELDGKVKGMAVYYFSYSTWKGRSMYIDDIVVFKEARGNGLGKALMDTLVEVAKEENVGKLHWQVLDWNEPAITFYKKYFASFDAEWVNVAVSRENLQKIR